MVTIKDLSSVIDNDVLQDLFIQRNELICHVSKEDKVKLEVLYSKQTQTEKDLETSLENFPNCFQETKKQVVKCVENHIESSAEVTGYFDEKLYKSGVLDGIVLMIQAINTKKISLKV